jgi:HSP20 family protein
MYHISVVHSPTDPHITRQEADMIVRHRSLTPTFDRNLDRAFEQLTSSFFDHRRSTEPVVEGVWSEGDYMLTVDLPGVPADAVDVSVRGTTLTIAVDHDELTWTRSLRLGGKLSPDKVDARHLDGRLTVRVGAVDEPEARTIEISTATPAIETTAEVDDAVESTDSGD